MTTETLRAPQPHILLLATPEIVHLQQAEQWRWLSTRQLLADAVRLAGLLPLDCTGILQLAAQSWLALND